MGADATLTGPADLVPREFHPPPKLKSLLSTERLQQIADVLISLPISDRIACALGDRSPCRSFGCAGPGFGLAPAPLTRQTSQPVTDGARHSYPVL